VSGPRLDVLAPQDAPVIVFRRAFAAPPWLVFEAWTEPRHLRRWRGPRGFELVACDAAPAVEVLDEVTFEEKGGATLVTGRSTFPSFEARDLYLDGGAERGLAESHEHLDELLRALLSRPQEGKDR
jgi:uncharacterized protein YndB with AHSA1/START domain